ncbi:MAG: hypothetical protein KF749_12965 [Bacteroidetes bacterium]|nr:hypothetical protein [Bacteroidota bacterium]MCW5894394.1 hypothetical protein [Bacteroidota bacterium]
MLAKQFSPLLDALSGKLGNVVVKSFKGKPYIARRPDMSRRKLSAKQRAQNGRFHGATQYAKAALKVPELRALYKHIADAQGMPTVSVAIRDFLNPPEIRDIDLGGYHRHPGDLILIHATDDVEVTQVEVAILNSNGETIESGPGVRSTTHPELWKYTATATLPNDGAFAVLAVATDRPGNKTPHAEAV